MNVIIFSKDRAMQLDLLLRSIKRNMGVDVSIMYSYSSEWYMSGYERLIGGGYNWVRVIDFKLELLNLVKDEFTLFFTDDSVVTRKFSLRDMRYFANDFRAVCYSMRLSPTVRYCFAEDKESNVPEIDGNGRFSWKGLDGDWGYPMSVEGHVFRTKDILPLLRVLEYSNPCELEALLAVSPISKPYMYCGDKSSMINIPLNQVQTGWKNRCGDTGVEYLNKMFLDGYRIDLGPLLDYPNTACHVLPKITFKK
jgi:hypothetical protein